MVPVQLELNLPHVRLENDRFHLGGWVVVVEGDRENAVFAAKILSINRDVPDTKV